MENNKYLKYKIKYINLKKNINEQSMSDQYNQLGGEPPTIIKNTNNLPSSYDSCTVVIIGAAIAGLSLGIFLKKNGIPCIIYEREPQIDAQSKGYSLTLNSMGLNILKKLDVFDEILKNSFAYQETDQHIVYSNGKVILGPKEIDSNNMYIARELLVKSLLMKARELEIDIKLGIQLQSITENTTGNINYITFNNGTHCKCKIIAACEGIYSPLRECIIRDPLRYTGVSTIWGLNKYDHPFANCGSLSVVDAKGTRLFINPYSTTHKMWLISRVTPENSEDALLIRKDKNKAYEKAVEYVKDWADTFKNFVETTPIDTIQGRALRDRDPDGYTNINHRYIALLGDAAHPMTPFKGQGANTALDDSLLFLNHINSQKNNEIISLNSYYGEMLKIRIPTVKKSFDKVNFYHTKDVLNLKKLLTFEKIENTDGYTWKIFNDRAKKLTLSLPLSLRKTSSENSNIAMILIDLVRDFTDPNGFANLRAIKKNKTPLDWKLMLENVERTVRIARFIGIKIIWIRSEYAYPENTPNMILDDFELRTPLDKFDSRSRNNVPKLSEYNKKLLGTHNDDASDKMKCCNATDKDRPWGSNFSEDLKPSIDTEDIIITKEQFSVFRKIKGDLNLDVILKKHNINKLIIGGIATNNCVTATIIDGFFLGYNIIVPIDITAASEPTREAAALQNFNNHYAKVIDTFEL